MREVGQPSAATVNCNWGVLAITYAAMALLFAVIITGVISRDVCLDMARDKIQCIIII